VDLWRNPDTLGTWDEILTDPRGDFEGFRSINVRTFEAALSKVE